MSHIIFILKNWISRLHSSRQGVHWLCKRVSARIKNGFYVLFPSKFREQARYVCCDKDPLINTKTKREKQFRGLIILYNALNVQFEWNRAVRMERCAKQLFCAHMACSAIMIDC